MTKRNLYSTCLSLIIMFFVITGTQPLVAQTSELNITGIVTESGTGLPLEQVSVSVASTGNVAKTDENGEFTIAVPDLNTELIFNYPGYTRRNIFLLKREFVKVALVSEEYSSFDDSYSSPNGKSTIKNTVYAVSSLTGDELSYSTVTSSDQILQGKVPGLNVTQQSGMPGHRTFMNIRGVSSIYANSEPLLLIDGMIYDYNYAGYSLMEGYALNPFDVLDIDDIKDISVFKNGASYLGSASSNGVIYINTEQQSEASTIMKFSSYGGITMMPKKQELLDASQFKNYFKEMLNSRGYAGDQINSMYPWLNGDESSEDFYRYNNNTDWQDEIYEPATVSKFHFFLKGGDEIATYNISTGYLSHQGIYENSSYSRYNLRINGQINISDKFTIIPNAKLSLADSKVANQGPGTWKNPILASLLKSPLMASYAKDEITGTELDYLDDVGVFGVSNPKAIISNAQGTNRNYHFLSSITAQYRFNEHFTISTLLGINFNNSRENIFLPDLGIVQIDSAYNSPGDFIYELRSTQNHSNITYSTSTPSGHSIRLTGGFRYLENSYKYNLSTDLNTPSDDFKSLGQGSQFSFLRSTIGDNRGLSWVSYYGDLNYNFRNKYLLNATVSYDGNSAVNENTRYNLYPSVGLGWRLSSEGFLNESTWLEELKLRASYSLSGNMYSSVYDNSKLYYTDRRLNGTGVLIRESIPNEDMELEKKSTVNAGLDLSMFRQLVNFHVDVYNAKVDNLIIKQELPATYGYTSYFNNGGKLDISGFEVSMDTRLHIRDLVWTLGASVSQVISTVNSLSFINPDMHNIVTSLDVAEFVTSEGNPVNAYYGYKTNGLISESDGTVIGPKGVPMQAGDIKFVDKNSDGIINDDDKMIIGDPNPEFFGGIYTSLSYKNIQLSAMINYSVGNDAFSYVRYKTEAMDSYANQSVAVLNHWTPSNTGGIFPKMAYGDPTGNTVFSDRWIEDASYVRLGQLTLSYDIPPIQGFVKGIGIYLTATNLFTLTNYSGYDPDFIYMNSPFYMGVDYGKMPQTKTFIIGLNLDL